MIIFFGAKIFAAKVVQFRYLCTRDRYVVKHIIRRMSLIN